MATPVELFTVIRAPYPTTRVTMNLPMAQFQDARASQASVQVKRSMLGRKITYVKSSDWETLVLTWRLTRQKALEVEAFINSYQNAPWDILIHDGSRWEANLIGQPIQRTATDRLGSYKPVLTGTESIELTLTFSARRIN